MSASVSGGAKHETGGDRIAVGTTTTTPEGFGEGLAEIDGEVSSVERPN